ncbi:50S ribosomal protein L11 methyltransferase [Thermocrinis sp.]|uniref:50S ribosomal protein L11 methyltransferase n=1 Tax=Thermocrinis sp. TaxID=2024383 RepID=UPI002FDCB496
MIYKKYIYQMEKEDFYEFLLSYEKGVEIIKEGEQVQFATYEPLLGMEPIEVYQVKAKAPKESFRPIMVGDFLITPPWIKSILINPGSAFGTGLHATTQLCLKSIQKFFQPGWSAVDVGCGSCILSIALKLLGASEVLAIDIDPLAVEECKKNARSNGVDLKVLQATPEELNHRFDFLVANLDIQVFRKSMPSIVNLFNKIGVFSGIYGKAELGEFKQMIKEYPVKVKSTQSKGDWFVVVLQKDFIL